MFKIYGLTKEKTDEILYLESMCIVEYTSDFKDLCDVTVKRGSLKYYTHDGSLCIDIAAHLVFINKNEFIKVELS